MLNIDKRHLQIILVLSSEFRAKHLLSLEELNWDLSQHVDSKWFPKWSEYTKKSADFRFHGSKSGPVFILVKVVHSLIFDTILFNKSSFIFPMN